MILSRCLAIITAYCYNFYAPLSTACKKDLKKLLIFKKECGIIYSVDYAFPIYRCAGPVQLNTVNHVRRGTEQH